MKVLFVSLCSVCLLTSGCSRKTDSSDSNANARAVVSGSHIKLPTDSPQLSRIQTVTAVIEHVPQEELIATREDRGQSHTGLAYFIACQWTYSAGIGQPWRQCSSGASCADRG